MRRNPAFSSARRRNTRSSTSAGIKNTSIHDALVDLLGKPIGESSALCIFTAMYRRPWVGPGEKAWQFISRSVRVPRSHVASMPASRSSLSCSNPYFGIADS
jgi:hypothetical protein